MKRFSLASGTALLAASAVLSAGFVYQDAVLLRLKLAPNTTDSYTIETVVKQTINMPNGMGEQDLTVSTKALYTLKTLELDGEKANVEATTKVEDIKMEGGMAGSMPGMDANTPPVVLKGKIDSRGRIVLETSKISPMAMALSGGSNTSTPFVELPEKAVKIGDTWDVIVPKGPMTQDEDQKMVAKLIGEKEFDGRKVWVVSMVGTVKNVMDSSKLPTEMKADSAGPMGDMKMIIRGTSEITSEGLVDKETGRTLQMTSTGKTKQAIELSDMGLNIETAGTISTKMTLKK
jgi:hypothetical protein